MAHDDLRSRIEALQTKGSQESNIRSILKHEGWSDLDITGALAAQKLKNSPVRNFGQIHPDTFKLKPQHAVGGLGNTLFQFAIIAAVIIVAPGAYGLVKGVLSPTIKGQQIVANEIARQYSVVGDIPADEKNLITVRPAAIPTPTQSSSPVTLITQTIASIISPSGTPTSTADFTSNPDANSVTTYTTPSKTSVDEPSNTTSSNDSSSVSPGPSDTSDNSNETPPPVQTDPTPTNNSSDTTNSGNSASSTDASTTPPETPSSNVSTPVALTAALAAAKGGEIITLAGGNYGDFTISEKYSSTVTIQSADSKNPATFHSLNFKNSSNVTANDIYIHFIPDMSTVDWSSTVYINNSDHITFENSTIKGEPAINGEPADSTTVDSTGNVIGWPTGYGISMPGSTYVSILNNDISGMDRGIIIAGNQITIRNNNIHNTRRTPIAGGANNLVIDSNYMHDIYPWAWGHTPYGDHADYLALWTDGKHSLSNINVTNNRMEIGSGVAVLGMWLQGTSDAINFSNVTIQNNVFIINNLQAIMLTYTDNAIIDHNTMMRTPGDVGPDDWKSSPRILFEKAINNSKVTNNITYEFDDKDTANEIGNSHSGNIYDQQEDPKKPWYYDQSLVQQAESMTDPTAIYNLVKSSLKNPGNLALNHNQALFAAVANALKSIENFAANLYL